MNKPATWFWKKQKEIDNLYHKYMMLCDGDCGNCYHEEDLNLTCYGENLCKECMFHFIWEQENATSTEHCQ